jgi:hypothetical protein
VDPRPDDDELTPLERRSDCFVGVHEIADELVRVEPVMEVDGAIAPPQRAADHARDEAHAITGQAESATSMLARPDDGSCAIQESRRPVAVREAIVSNGISHAASVDRARCPRVRHLHSRPGRRLASLRPVRTLAGG